MVEIPGGFVASAHKEPAYECENPRTAFMDELSAYGFEARVGMKLPPVPEPGRVVRIAAPDDKKGKQSGWYWFSEFTDDFKPGALIGVGVFGSWKGNPERVVWTSKRRESMSPAEQSRLDDQMKAAKIARDNEIALAHKEAATKASVIYAEAAAATPDHPYLVAKGIQPHGVRVSQGKIVVPVTNAGEIISLQFIDANGGKKFLPGGKVSGGYFMIGDQTETVYVAEGYATAATIHEATGDRVYVAYNAGNLMDVTGVAKDQNPDAQIVIAGDDDHKTKGNPGRAKADAAGAVMRCKVVYPEIEGDDTDFNDMARRHGIEAVRALIDSKPNVYEKSTGFDTLPASLLNPPGILGDIAAYYNATARAPQPGFAVQAALAVGSIILGRHFRTENANFTSIYFLNIAKSGTGKEHAKTVIEDVLKAAGVDSWVNGSGYTSAGAVFSTLLRSPKHITILDEFGRYLEASKGGKNTNLHEANTQLMEAITRGAGVMRPTAYSTMTLSKEKADEFASRKCVNPAITLLAMTTPAALYKNLDNNNIADGFLGRFVIHQSNVARQVHDHKGLIDVPNRIVDWVKQVIERSGQDVGVQGIASEDPQFVTLQFSQAAKDILREFNQYTIDVADGLENVGLDALPGRSPEMAMKIALIVALSENSHQDTISQSHMEWAIEYVKFSLDQSVSIFKMRVSGSDHEADKKEILQAIRDAGGIGVSWTEIQKRPPFSKFKRKDLKEIMATLTDAELIAFERVDNGKPGRPREAYIAIG